MPNYVRTGQVKLGQVKSNYERNFLDPNFSGLLKKKFVDPKYVWTQNFVGSKILSDPKIVYPIFCVTQNFAKTENLVEPKIFFEPKNFPTQKFF